MSELAKFTSDEVLTLTELPSDISVEEGLLVAGVLHGLAHDEFLRVVDRPRDTEQERTEGWISSMRVFKLWNYADKVTELVRHAVPDDSNLARLVDGAGLNDDPRIVVDIDQPHWFIQPNKDDVFARIDSLNGSSE